MGLTSRISDYVKDKVTPGVSLAGAADHALNGNTWQNQAVAQTHSPTAGALLQTSTICCSARAESDGQVIEKPPEEPQVFAYCS